MLSYMECFLSVTAASQSEPVLFTECSIDSSVAKFSTKFSSLFRTLGSLRKTLFISKCIYPRESRCCKWKSCCWMQNKVFVYLFLFGSE